MNPDKLIIFHFYSSKWYLPFGRLIKAKCNSKYDHVAIEIPEEGVFESKFIRGVKKNKKIIRQSEFKISCHFDKKSNIGKKYLNFLESQVGKGFDYKAILFGFWGIKCESHNRWYCSELADTYFSIYLNYKSVIKTTVSPKVFLAKIEAFLVGCNYEE